MSADHDMSQPIISTEGLKVYFPSGRGETVKAVDGVDVAVERGQTFGVIGESGSGKSTLGRAIVGLLKPTGGRMVLDGTDPTTLSASQLRKWRRNYQIIFQDPHSALNPRMRIIDSVCEPLVIVGTPKAERLRKAAWALERVGLEESYGARYPHQLSGGQKQRVNIARALTLEPKLLVCDEIVAALDVSIQADILNLLADLQRSMGLTYVFITHDLGVVSHVSDRVAVMYLGTFVEVGRAADITLAPRHPYTEALLSAEPEPYPAAMRNHRRIILSGEIPSPVSPPSGCRFRTRCRFAQDICASERPPMRPIGDGHSVACHFAETLVLHGQPRSGPATAPLGQGVQS